MRRSDDNTQDKNESRPSTRPRSQTQTGLSVIDTSKLQVATRPDRHRRAAREDDDDRDRPSLSRRELLLRWGGATIATAAGLSVLSQTKIPTQVFNAVGRQFSLAQPPATATPPPPKSPFGYFHAFFEVNNPDEVAEAAALGINYTITYGDWSWASADPTSAMGKALTKYGIKTFLNIEYPFLTCKDGYGYLNEVDKVRDLIGQFHTSPLVAGYWTKDDTCGDESVAVKGIHDLIRSIDQDPNHWIMPGFGETSSIDKVYYHGMADIICLYPYPAYGPGPAKQVPEMLKIIQKRTPPGAKPPPFVGVYQDFASPPSRPVLPASNVIDQVTAYMNNGAAGIAGFGWEAPNETQVVRNNTTLRDNVSVVTQWLAQNGYGSRPTP